MANISVIGQRCLFASVIFVLFIFSGCGQKKATVSLHSSRSKFNSYKGRVMTGYQGWFNTPDDGANRGWAHYGKQGKLEDGICAVDFLPEISEYEKTYDTPLKLADGTAVKVFSSHDSTSVELHFKWMKDYNIDGAFMQRFVSSLKTKNTKKHIDRVLQSALTASRKHDRAIALMYDLSGMETEADVELIKADWKMLVSEMKLTGYGPNQTYLYHHGKPLVAIWGPGFNAGKKNFSLRQVDELVDFLKNDPVYGGCSIMLGVPTFWREFGNDTKKDSTLHRLIKHADIVMPWFVGRYKEDTYPDFKQLIADDMVWCKAHQVDYAPLVFPGFSWYNLKNGEARSNGTPRNKGDFFWKQIKGAIEMGAEMLYVAMFDEIDEGTAIFKVAKEVPPPGKSKFVAPEPEIPSDYYLFLTGKAREMLRGEIPVQNRPNPTLTKKWQSVKK